MPIDLDEARKFAKECARQLSVPRLYSLVIQFADEVERLRVDNSNLRDDLTQAWRLTPAALTLSAAETERLRAQNGRLLDELARTGGLTNADTEAARTVEAEREHWQSKYTASQEEMTELLTEHRKLREALYAHKDEITRLKQERRDNFDEIKERF
jgi:phage-related minor tail protein